MNVCPHCGQEVPEARFGIHLSPVKAKIFDAIERCGDNGIFHDDLFDLALRERGSKQTVLKVHVSQINAKLTGTDYRIRCTGGRDAVYRLVKTTEDFVSYRAGLKKKVRHAAP